MPQEQRIKHEFNEERYLIAAVSNAKRRFAEETFDAVFFHRADDVACAIRQHGVFLEEKNAQGGQHRLVPRHCHIN